MNPLEIFYPELQDAAFAADSGEDKIKARRAYLDTLLVMMDYCEDNNLKYKKALKWLHDNEKWLKIKKLIPQDIQYRTTKSGRRFKRKPKYLKHIPKQEPKYLAYWLNAGLTNININNTIPEKMFNGLRITIYESFNFKNALNKTLDYLVELLGS